MKEKDLPYDVKIFRNDGNIYLTNGLFCDAPVFKEGKSSLKDYTTFILKSNEDVVIDGKKYYSLKRLYLSCSDPTEYVFANTYLYGWEHWQVMLKSKYIFPEVEKWREEIAVKIRAEAVAKCIESSKEGNFNAAKWIACKGWETSRGRPSKAEKEGRLKQDTKLTSQVKEDMERLGMAVVK